LQLLLQLTDAKENRCRRGKIRRCFVATSQDEADTHEKNKNDGQARL